MSLSQLDAFESDHKTQVEYNNAMLDAFFEGDHKAQVEYNSVVNSHTLNATYHLEPSRWEINLIPQQENNTEFQLSFLMARVTSEQVAKTEFLHFRNQIQQHGANPMRFEEHKYIYIPMAGQVQPALLPEDVVPGGAVPERVNEQVPVRENREEISSK